MKKLVFGVGINDSLVKVFSYKELTRKENGKRNRIRECCPFYKKWQQMLARCYSEAYKKRFPTYENCKVVDEWIYFSNFKAWMETQDWEGKELDKDILFPGNKIYGPETCVFVTSRVNYFMLDCGASRGLWPIGVSFHKRIKKFAANCSSYKESRLVFLGYYNTPEEAHQAWLEYKIKQAYLLAEDLDDTRVSQAIIKRYENYGSSSLLGLYSDAVD